MHVPAPRSALALVGLLVGCAGPAPDETAMGCTALVAPPAAPDPVGPSDTLDVIVALPRRQDDLELLVRVDPVDEEGIVLFPDDVPATAAGVGTTLTTRAIYTVCVSSAPRAIVFQGEVTPHDKAWVRVSTDRPVKTLVRIGGDRGVTLDPPVVVEPGASARQRWTMPEGAR